MRHSIIPPPSHIPGIINGAITKVWEIVKLQPPSAEYQLCTLMSTTGKKTDEGKLFWAIVKDFSVKEQTPLFTPPYRIGQKLYVREATFECSDKGVITYCYEADGAKLPYKTHRQHMPKSAARIFLEVTGVECKRVQDVTEDDALCAGLTKCTKDGKIWKFGMPDTDGLPGGYKPSSGWAWSDWEASPADAFAKMIGSDDNPYIFITTFKTN